MMIGARVVRGVTFNRDDRPSISVPRAVCSGATRHPVRFVPALTTRGEAPRWVADLPSLWETREENDL